MSKADSVDWYFSSCITWSMYKYKGLLYFVSYKCEFYTVHKMPQVYVYECMCVILIGILYKWVCQVCSVD